MIDMEGPLNVWYHHAEPIMSELHGFNGTDNEESKEKSAVRSEKAEVSRRLLELADALALMEALVRNEYWVYKERGLDIEVGVFSD